MYLILSYKSLNLSSLFLILFSFFVALIGWIPLHCLWDHWSFLLFHIVCYQMTRVFISSLIFRLRDYCFKLYNFLYLLLEILTMFLQSSPNEHLYNCYFELFARWIAYLYFIKFFFFSILRFLSCSFIWNILHSFLILLD